MASDDLRARIAEALCPPHHRIGSVSSGQPLTPLSPCQLHQAQAQTVVALVDAEVDAVARRGAAAVAAMGVDVRAARAERGRYQLAWLSARHRAQAYGEGVLRHVADREQWKSWAGKQEARAQRAEAALAEYEHVRASVTAGEPLGRALTVSEVLEQHEVTRKELIHELGEGLHLNWRQVIVAVGRMRRAAFDWMKAFEETKAERDAALATVERVRALAEKWQREDGPLLAKAVVQAASARLYRALTEPTTEE